MSRTSSGMSIQRLVLTSCSMRFIGKTGASISGPMGLPSGPRGGSIGVGRSAARLYHCRGISLSLRRIFTFSMFFILSGLGQDAAGRPQDRRANGLVLDTISPCHDEPTLVAGGSCDDSRCRSPSQTGGESWLTDFVIGRMRGEDFRPRCGPTAYPRPLLQFDDASGISHFPALMG